MSRAIRLCLLLIAASAALLAIAPAAGAVKLRKIADFDQPVYATGAPGFRKLLFVVEKPGTVRVVKNGHKLRKAFLNIRGLVNDNAEERGLLSIAFPPNYKQSGRFYVYFTDDEGDIRVEEYLRRSATRARRGSRRPLIEVNHRENDNHNGGQLQFLGDLLFIGTGDGGGGGDVDRNAQNLDSLLGKILRIDPGNPSGGAAYSIPASNPFVGRNGRDEIFSYGLRNPWRFSFDTFHQGGPYIVIGDVGQDQAEEVDYETVAAASGANFGWNSFEGFDPYPGGAPDPGGTVKPILAYPLHSHGNCAITGGYVVRGNSLPGLRGRYVYADYCRGQLRSLVPQLGGAAGDRSLGLRVELVSSFGEDTRGRVYVCSLNGPVFRLVKGG